MPCKVCLVTEELSLGPDSGGLGAAFHELALALKEAGHQVDLLFVPVDANAGPATKLASYYEDRGIRILDPGLGRFVWEPFTYERRSYAIFRYLVSIEEPYDFIHFHDYKGLGFASIVAKSQRLGFPNSVLIVQVHGPTRWTLETNDYPFSHEAQLKIDFMERECIARADIVVSPSRYILEWLKQQGWKLPNRVEVIQNVSVHIKALLGTIVPERRNMSCNEIIFFGRHEERKGLVPFCDALDLINDDLANSDITVTFLGPLGIVNNEASLLYLTERSTKWRFPLQFLPDFDRLTACRYLAKRKRSIVIVPSFSENSPYTVVEAAIATRPLITSLTGGASELLDPSLSHKLTCRIERRSLAEKILTTIEKGLPPARLAIPPEETVKSWLALHANREGQPRSSPANKTSNHRRSPPTAPKVVVAITHFERPAKLYDALMSLAVQTYPNIEIIVVDDGSKGCDALDLLGRLLPLMKRLNVTLLRQENRYLGAARNCAIQSSESDYILFLDDDDIAFPNLVQMLVTAAEATGADAVNCLNLFMPEARRHEAHPFPDMFSQKVSHIPLGGPLSIAPLENCFGSATALLRRSSLHAFNGYTDLFGVGHEDFELYTRMVQSGLRIEVCPLPLYLYEVDHQSMVSSTSPLRNWNRVARAIDMRMNPGAWGDIVSLTAGQRAQEHATNFAQYRISINPHGELLQQIAAEGQQTAKYADRIVDYAVTIGAVSAERAARALAATRSARTAHLSSMPIQSIAERVALRDGEPTTNFLVVGALIDLAFSRVSEAIATFELLWQREPGSVSQGHSRLLSAIASCADLTPAHATQILNLLRRIPPGQGDLYPLIPALFRLAICADEMQTAGGMVQSAMTIDQDLYLAANQDVAAAVEAGEYSSALDHFVRVGGIEGRFGFKSLYAIRYALRAQTAVDVPITSLRQYISSRQNGHGQSVGPDAAETAKPASLNRRVGRPPLHHRALA
jgi:glycosyltransferase involved in cell wall biosynthesis/GT2 family glycosyltransferase